MIMFPNLWQIKTEKNKKKSNKMQVYNDKNRRNLKKNEVNKI
ncbi:hypothetical protein [Clostridium thailandense]|nr:hypothetical protein [Clostridium thailandense]